jgi:hypothetical protein
MALRKGTRPVDDAHRSYQVAADQYAEQVAVGNDYSWGVDDSGWQALFDGSNNVRVHVSVTAAAGAVVSVVGLYTVLTGLLAGEGLVIAAVGLVVSLAGLVASNRPARTGSGLAGLGILCSLAAIVLAVAALTGVFSWPNSNSDDIGSVHTWLVEFWARLHHQF